MLPAYPTPHQHLITISESNQDLLENVADKQGDKVRLLHNGIDLSTFSPAQAPDRPSFTILCVARLVEKKGLPYLIEACRHLRDRGLDFQCWIVGSSGDGVGRSKGGLSSNSVASNPSSAA